MQINYSKIPKVLHNIEFHISEDADWDPYGLKVTEACERAIATAHEAVVKKAFLGAQTIRNFIRRYPQIPMFKNHLWRYYLAVGYTDQAMGAAEQAIQENPEYFYGRLMLANSLMLIPDRRAEIPGLVNQWNIVEYAGRNTLAYHEVMNYYILAAEYYFQKGDKKQAQGFLYFLELMGFGEEPAFVQVRNRMR